jgi:hypothetical protein
LHKDRASGAAIGVKGCGHCNKVTQTAFPPWELDLSAIADSIRSEFHDFTASFRRENRESVAFVDRSRDRAYLSIASIDTDEMGLSILTDVAVQGNSELRIRFARAAPVLKPP